MDVIGCAISCGVTLCVGLLQSENVLKGIGAVLQAFDLETSGAAWITAWTVVVLVVTFFVMGVVWAVRRFLARFGGVKRRRLNQVADVCFETLKYLRVLAREFERETEFDMGALSQLRDLAGDCQEFMRRILKHPALITAESYDQRVCTLRDAVREHTHAEIYVPLHLNSVMSEDDIRPLLTRGHAGVDCVLRLVAQMDLEVAKQPAKGLQA